ncbi:hypothetical protein Fmac_013948 [Flemingia macrophylla]|uniref:Uncharacterized protein n=1 Tax=Flemingia macrophylla TaxID=520843 RepID=A0ABD1MCB4_9FABA
MRGFGFQQQQHCADEAMWMENQAQHQESYAFHEESWASENNHQKQFPNMMHMNKHGAFGDSKHHGVIGGNGNCGMFQGGIHNNHGYGHGGGKKFPFGGNKASHQFSNGGRKFNSGGHQGYIMDEIECEGAYAEEHVGAVVDEMRYERHKYQGGDSCYVNPYGRNMNHKPHHWTAKGV